MTDNKLASDVNLIKAVEQLEDELRPFIEAQREARGLGEINDKIESAITPNLAADPQPTSLTEPLPQTVNPSSQESNSEPSDKT